MSEVTVAADQAATLQFSDQVTVIVPPSAVSPDSVITLHQVSGVPAGAGPLTSAGSPVDIQLDNGAQTGDVLIQYRLSPTAEVLGQPVGPRTTT